LPVPMGNTPSIVGPLFSTGTLNSLRIAVKLPL
jgi:hypothetical protein